MLSASSVTSIAPPLTRLSHVAVRLRCSCPLAFPLCPLIPDTRPSRSPLAHTLSTTSLPPRLRLPPRRHTPSGCSVSSLALLPSLSPCTRCSSASSLTIPNRLTPRSFLALHPPTTHSAQKGHKRGDLPLPRPPVHAPAPPPFVHAASPIWT